MFDESAWPPTDGRQQWYWDHVAVGKARMSESSVTFLGLARDVASTLRRSIAQIEAIGEQFAEYRAIVYENDSKDDTPAILQDWCERNPFATCCCETRNRPRISGRDLTRVQRLAEYRGWLQGQWRHHPTDYVVMLDLDLRGGFSRDGIAHTIGCDNWEMMGANGLIWRNKKWNYYDAWAFRKLGHPDPHTPEEINPLVLERGAPLMPVDSCFGGLGVYTRRAFETGSYEGGDDIEHACFHRSLLKAGMRLFHNPSMIAIYEGKR